MQYTRGISTQYTYIVVNSNNHFVYESSFYKKKTYWKIKVPTLKSQNNLKYLINIFDYVSLVYLVFIK